MELNFGKFKGQKIEDVPTSYLAYLLEADFVEYEIKAECLGIINFRYSDYELPTKHFNQEVIDKAYKKLVHRHHPDTGGNHYAMMALNEFRQNLFELL